MKSLLRVNCGGRRDELINSWLGKALWCAFHGPVSGLVFVLRKIWTGETYELLGEEGFQLLQRLHNSHRKQKNQKLQSDPQLWWSGSGKNSKGCSTVAFQFTWSCIFCQNWNCGFDVHCRQWISLHAVVLFPVETAINAFAVLCFYITYRLGVNEPGGL